MRRPLGRDNGRRIPFARVNDGQRDLIAIKKERTVMVRSFPFNRQSGR